MRGSTPRDNGALTNLTALEAAHIRETDPLAARYLVPYIVLQTLLKGAERWCLRLSEQDSAAIAQSRELSERVARVALSRAGNTDVPPWVFLEERQTGGPFIALARRMSRSADVIALRSFDQGEVVGDQVWVIGEKHLLTAGVVASRAYRVWLDTVTKKSGTSVSVSASAVHNTFPLPHLSDAQQRAIEDASERMLLARTYASPAIFQDLNDRAKMPRPLLQAHDDIDAIIAEVFGVDVACTDAQMQRALIRSHRELTENAKPPSKNRAA